MIQIGTHPKLPGRLVWREGNKGGVLWEDTPAHIRREAVERGYLPGSTIR
jgi:hypothetical protein